MITRRSFISMLASAAALPAVSWGQQSGSGKTVLYASNGPELSWWDVDVANATLTKRGSVALPANVQYVWPHISRQYLYATSSDSASGIGGVVGKNHHATALRIDPTTGALTRHGNPVALPSRPIHNATDRKSEYLLTAYNNPSAVTVHRINGDGTVGDEIKQPQPLDAGIFAHQVLATPNDRLVIVVARGNDATKDKPEDPGALKVFRFNNGVLSNGPSVAPNGGMGFGVRHLDFHPTQPWIYVSNERHNKLEVFRLDGDTVSPKPLFVKELLADPKNERPRQLGGTVHVHPNGRVVYGINRSDYRVSFEGRQVYGGGENSIAVFAIDQKTGEPTLIQHVETHGFHPRTFHIDPSGRMLVAAHITGMNVREGANVVHVPATMSVFRIADDGKLTYVRKYDVDVGKAFMWWMGMVAL
jgi:6-phosphogluconolactonase